MDYKNENLLLSGVDEGKLAPVMTVPAIISVYDLNTGNPLTDADIVEGMNIDMTVIKVSETWWNNPNMFDAWRLSLERVGCTGDVIRFEDVNISSIK